MSGKIRNPARRCKACGAKCSEQMRYCHTCAIERRVKAKALKVFGIPPEKISVTVVGGAVRPPCTTHKALGLDNGVYFTPKAALRAIREQPADIVTANPPLSTGDYLGEPLPKARRIGK